MNCCERCEMQFLYEPRYHRCPGEWEAIVGKLDDPYAGMSWVEECMAKQREKS